MQDIYIVTCIFILMVLFRSMFLDFYTKSIPISIRNISLIKKDYGADAAVIG